jgi:hypothetical protein
VTTEAVSPGSSHSFGIPAHQGLRCYDTNAVPRKLRLITGEVVTCPRPIENCPASKAVADHRNEVYFLFVDETFREFFRLNDSSGYLCYAALGIPEKEYEFFKRALARIFATYEAYVVGDSGLKLREFKFEDFRRMERPQREDIAGKISKLMKMYGAFFVGFYTRVAGVVMEHVRSNLVGTTTAVPDDYDTLYEEAAAELRSELQGVGQSACIAKILRFPVLATAHFLAYFGCKFKVLCDPRESKEDRAVQKAIDDLMTEHFARAAPEEAVSYLGMDNSRESHTEPGLQIADLLAGEVRSLFENHAGLLTVGSSAALIGGNTREDMEWWETASGVFQKLGRIHKIPPELRPTLERTDGTNCLPLYRHSLAAGLLTCYTDLGQPRHIEVFEGNFFEQTD